MPHLPVMPKTACMRPVVCRLGTAGMGGGIVVLLHLHITDEVVRYTALLFGRGGSGQYRHGAVYLVGIGADDFGVAQLLRHCHGNGTFTTAGRA